MEEEKNINDKSQEDLVVDTNKKDENKGSIEQNSNGEKNNITKEEKCNNKKKSKLLILLIISLIPIIYIIVNSFGTVGFLCGIDGGECSNDGFLINIVFSSFILVIMYWPVAISMIISMIICISKLIKIKKEDVPIIPAIISVVVEIIAIIVCILLYR